MSTGRPRGSYAVGRERRERILDAATEKFEQAGYTKTSLAEIARDVGISVPGLVHHFPTKQHLLLAIAERRFDRSAKMALAAPPDMDGTGVLRMMLGISQLFASQPGLIELFVQVGWETSDPQAPAHALYRERYDRVIERITSRFNAAVIAGFLRPDRDYAALARECVAVADGLQLQWVLTSGGIDFVGSVRSHLERLAPYILVDGREVDLSA